MAVTLTTGVQKNVTAHPI